MKHLTTIILSISLLTSLSFAQKGCYVYFNESIVGYDVTVEAMYTVDSIISDATFVWDFGDGSLTESGNPVTHTFSGAGVYEIVVTATGVTSGCVATESKTILLDVDPLDITLTKGWAITDDYTSGWVSATVTGGSGVFSYSWTGGATGSDNITGLSPGTYCVTVTDDNYGITAEACATLATSNPVYVDLVLTQLDPADPNSVRGEAIISGGFSPYSFEWFAAGGIIPGETESVVTGLSINDSICVTVTDAVGSTDSDCEVLSGPCSGFYASYTLVPASGPGIADGSIDVSVTGGYPPFTYNWSNGITTQDNEDITTGPYSVTITDDIGCNVVYNIFLPYESEPPTELTIRSFSYVWQVVGSEATADVTVNIEGGTSPYDYSWYQSDGSSDFIDVTNYDIADTHNTVTGAEPDYIVDVTVTDDVGDNAYASVNIPVYDEEDPYGDAGSMGAYVDTCLLEDDIVQAHIINYWVGEVDGNLYASWHVVHSSEDDETLVINYGDASSLYPGSYTMYLYIDCDVDFKTMTTFTDYIILDSDILVIETTEVNHIELYPNPVKDKLYIKTWTDMGKGRIYITDASGRLLISRCIEANRTILIINTVDLPSGIYSMTIETDDTRTVKKFIK